MNDNRLQQQLFLVRALLIPLVIRSCLHVLAVFTRDEPGRAGPGTAHNRAG